MNSQTTHKEHELCMPTSNLLTYVCPCIIYEIEERYPLDATIYLLL